MVMFTNVYHHNLMSKKFGGLSPSMVLHPRNLLLFLLIILLLPLVSAQDWDYYIGDDFTGVSTDWTGGTLDTVNDWYDGGNSSTFTWGNTPCFSNVTACRWTVSVLLNKTNNGKYYPQTRNSSTDNGHLLIEDDTTNQVVKPEPNYVPSDTVAYGWVEINLTYNRTSKDFDYEDSLGGSFSTTFADTNNYTYLRLSTGSILVGGSLEHRINYTQLWLPSGEYINSSSPATNTTNNTLLFNQSASGFISGTHKNSYYALINNGLLQDYTGTNGSYYYDGSYLSIPKYDSSTSFSTMNTCGGGSIGTLSMNNHFVVTDELSQFGQMIAMGNNETMVIAYMNTLDEINASGQSGKLWCYAYQSGSFTTSIVTDTASDGDARIMDSLFTISGNDAFTNATRNRAYTHASTMASDFVLYQVLSGNWTSTIDGSTLSWLGCGGTNVCTAETNSGFMYTGYYGDNALALLKACKRTGITNYCDVADDLMLGLLQASGEIGNYYDGITGFRTVEGIHHRWDGGSPTRPVCTNNCGGDWDYSDAPRLSSVGIYEWYRTNTSTGGNSNLTDYLTDWSASVDDSSVSCVSSLSYGVKWNPNGTCTTHQSGFFELGLGSQLVFWTNETLVYDYLEEAFTHYNNVSYEWDSGEFGIYRQTFLVRTYGIAMGLDNDSYTLYSSLTPPATNTTLRVYVIDNINSPNNPLQYNFTLTNYINSTIDTLYTKTYTDSNTHTYYTDSNTWYTIYTYTPTTANYTGTSYLTIESNGANSKQARIQYFYSDGTNDYSNTITNVFGAGGVINSFTGINSSKTLTSIKVQVWPATSSNRVWIINALSFDYYAGLYKELIIPVGTYIGQLTNNTGYTSNEITVNATITGTTYDMNLTVQQTRIFYLNFYNESTNTLLTENIIGHVIGSQDSRDFSTSNGSVTITALIPDTYEITYWSNEETPRSYYVTLQDNSFENLTLYLIATDISSLYVLEVNDELGEACQNNTVSMLRYYTDINGYRVVEMDRTDTLGQAVFFVRPNIIPYKFVFIGSCGSYTSNVGEITQSTNTYTISDSQGYLTAYDFIDSISTSLTFTEATNTFIYTWVDTSNIVTAGCLTITKLNSGVRTTAYNSCSSLASGSLIYSTNSSDYNESVYFAQGRINTNTEFSTLFTSVVQNRIPALLNWGAMGILVTALIVMSLVLFASSSAVTTVLALITGLGIMVYTNVLGITWTIFVGIAIIGGVLMYKLTR